MSFGLTSNKNRILASAAAGLMAFAVAGTANAAIEIHTADFEDGDMTAGGLLYATVGTSIVSGAAVGAPASGNALLVQPALPSRPDYSALFLDLGPLLPPGMMGSVMILSFDIRSVNNPNLAIVSHGASGLGEYNFIVTPGQWTTIGQDWTTGPSSLGDIRIDGGFYIDNIVYQTDFTQAPVDPSAVPEPATWAMMIVGFGLAGTHLRRRKHAPALA